MDWIGLGWVGFCLCCIGLGLATVGGLDWVQFSWIVFCLSWVGLFYFFVWLVSFSFIMMIMTQSYILSTRFVIPFSIMLLAAFKRPSRHLKS